ncbi:hypothetical protein LCGC14_2235300 [marine sediment metagenome]|uniref:Uncharacterized protein n=1 Tax=marine sediment metagenome TaxID=412755 RepID=A0A0F9G224_9ZZZZ
METIGIMVGKAIITAILSMSIYGVVFDKTILTPSDSDRQEIVETMEE